MNCNICGFPSNENDQICRNCGNPINRQNLQNVNPMEINNLNQQITNNTMNQTLANNNFTQPPVNSTINEQMPNSYNPQQTNLSNNYNQPEPTKELPNDNKNKYIILAISIILIVVITIFAVTHFTKDKDKTNSNSNNEIASKNQINVTTPKNIETETYVNYDNSELIVYLTNNGSENIEYLNIVAAYYDKNNQLIGVDENSCRSFKSGSKNVDNLFLPNPEYYQYERIEVSVMIEPHEDIYQETLYNDQISTTYQKVERELEITVSNNSEVNLRNELGVIFIKDNKPIAAVTEYINVDAKDNGIVKVYIPVDWDKEFNGVGDGLIEYDSVEIIVNSSIKVE